MRLRELFPNLSRAAASKSKPLAKSLLDGLTAYVKKSYVERRSRKTGRPESTFRDGADADACFRDVAIYCFTEDIDIERYLACAEDTLSKKTRYPTPQHLKGPFLKRMIVEWLSPAERAEQTDDGKAIERGTGGIRPEMVSRSVPLDRNWPGLYDED